MRIVRELRYIGRWERKKMSDQVGGLPLGVPFRSQIAVSVSQNVRAFLGTMGFRCESRNAWCSDMVALYVCSNGRSAAATTTAT